MQCQSYTWEDRGASVAIRVPLPGAIPPAAASAHVQCEFSAKGLQLSMREGLDGSDRPLVSAHKSGVESSGVSLLAAQGIITRSINHDFLARRRISNTSSTSKRSSQHRYHIVLLFVAVRSRNTPTLAV